MYQLLTTFQKLWRQSSEKDIIILGTEGWRFKVKKMITFKIDEFAPCLKEVETGEIYDTEVVRLKEKVS